MHWITKDGRKLKISKMQTSHILNCIKMMDRQMCAALNKTMAYNDESYSEPPDSWMLIYEALVNEYNRRIK
jgi:hypothetical protein